MDIPRTIFMPFPNELYKNDVESDKNVNLGSLILWELFEYSIHCLHFSYINTNMIKLYEVGVYSMWLEFTKTHSSSRSKTRLRSLPELKKESF